MSETKGHLYLLDYDSPIVEEVERCVNGYNRQFGHKPTLIGASATARRTLDLVGPIMWDLQYTNYELPNGSWLWLGEFTRPVAAKTSSNVEGFWYDGDDLFIQFKGGRAYLYPEMRPSFWYRLLAAPSTGEFINQFIKDGFRYEKLKGPLPTMTAPHSGTTEKITDGLVEDAIEVAVQRMEKQGVSVTHVALPPNNGPKTKGNLIAQNIPIAPWLMAEGMVWVGEVIENE